MGGYVHVVTWVGMGVGMYMWSHMGGYLHVVTWVGMGVGMYMWSHMGGYLHVVTWVGMGVGMYMWSHGQPGELSFLNIRLPLCLTGHKSSRFMNH